MSINKSIDICIFSGGGMNIFQTCGACSCLQSEHHFEFNNAKIYIGSSAGSILALLISIGYSNVFIQKAFEILHVKNPEIDVDTVMNFLHTFGIIESQKILNYVSLLLVKKDSFYTTETTFLDHFHFTKNKLIITGTCVESMTTELFSVDTHPTMPILLAIQISISIPFVMKPVWYNGYRYVDGALYNNCYIEYLFDNEQCINELYEQNNKRKLFVFAIELCSEDLWNVLKKEKKKMLNKKTYQERQQEALWTYGYQIIRGICIHNQSINHYNTDLRITELADYIDFMFLKIPIHSEDSIQFDMSIKRKNKMFNDGYNYCRDFMKQNEDKIEKEHQKKNEIVKSITII